ncbi:MAG: hypothetical protein UY04_C0013G0001, partial [Parcubacteria group bacterium GW2011_GWA2_47_7]
TLFILKLLLVISLAITGLKITKTGDPFNKDVSLRGGIAATVYTEKALTEEEIQTALAVPATIKTVGDITTGKQLGFIIEVSDLTEEQLKQVLSKKLGITIDQNNFSIETTSPKLSQAFYKQ